MAIPVSDTRELDTLVTSAIDTISGNPANLVNEGGEKLLGKLAKRGRIFRVNDAERVEHPVMYGTDGADWETNLGDNYGNNGLPYSGTALGDDQNEVLTKALFDIVTKTKNFNVPQSIIGRDSQLAMSDIAYLAQRMAMETYAEEEALLLLGQKTLTAGGTLNPLAPYRGDNDFFNRAGGALPGAAANFGSMSMLGLFDSGRDNSAHTFGGIAPVDDSDWEAQLWTATDADPTTSDQLDTFLADVQEALIRTDYGGMERPTDILSTIDWYSRFLEALRSKGTINDTLIRDMGVGPNTEIPFGSVLVDYSRHLDADTQWDLTVDGGAMHPVIGLNLNSLRWNLVGQTTGVGADAGWIQQKSEMAPHPTLTNFFKRLEYRSCFSLDNGRRSHFLIKGWTL